LQGAKTDRAQLDKIRRALEKWEQVRVEMTNYRKDGREFTVELSITPIANEQGWYTHWVSVHRARLPVCPTGNSRERREVVDDQKRNSPAYLRAQVGGFSAYQLNLNSFS